MESKQQDQQTNQTSSAPIWVGLDLIEGNRGPLAFAQWLSSSSEPALGLHAVHVVEGHDLWGHASTAEALDLERLAHARMEVLLEGGGPGPRSIEVAIEDSPEDYFRAAARDSRISTLVIGRIAKRNQDNLVRLGSVARRLLRELPCPLAVVPPDLAANEVGAGPILVGVDLDEGCIEAVRYAEAMGKALGRPLVLAHIAYMPEGWGAGVVGSDAYTTVTAQIEKEAREKLESFVSQHKLSGHEVQVTQGAAVPRLHAMAQAADAVCIVVGSRRLGVVGRWFAGSTSSDLSAGSVVPVVVVPPQPGADTEPIHTFL